MLMESSLIFNALGWGLKTWITSFWFSKIDLMMFMLNVLEVNLKTCKIFIIVWSYFAWRTQEIDCGKGTIWRWLWWYLKVTKRVIWKWLWWDLRVTKGTMNVKLGVVIVKFTLFQWWKKRDLECDI
jgi:hypothetical protein